MRCASLISGSKANSFYIETDQDALLIDTGLSLPKTELALANLNLDYDKIRGILITHEHEDHVRHLKKIAHYFSLPVYITEESYKKTGYSLRDVHIIKAGDTLDFSSLTVETFQVLHDSEMCLGFVFHGDQKKAFYASDIGSYDDQILQKAENSHFIGIESNYELSMLKACRYPQHLKNRISGGAGHLANHEASAFIREIASNITRHVMFLHISENSNCPSHIEKMIDQDLFHFNPQISYKTTNRHSHGTLITI